MAVDRAGRYERIYSQLNGLIAGRSPNLLAGMATVCAVLHAKMPHHLWTGFYLVTAPNELHVGPYQGPVACQVLSEGGICLHSVGMAQPVVVADVREFPGHVACDSRARSEIVVPLMRGGDVVAVLDVDSAEIGAFSEQDVEPLERIIDLLKPLVSAVTL
jgi:L-methionine (R)-S-oxide reductase